METNRPMETQRRRDSQQWILDWVIKQTGRYMNFAYDERMVPKEVKSYRMIPRVLYKKALHYENVARGAEENGHTETARQVYWKASQVYKEAQHVNPVFKHDDTEKVFLYKKHIECYDKVVQFTDSPVETVEIPWEGKTIQGRLHLLNQDEPAPTVLFLPGMDMTKETFPNPITNQYRPRGFNVLTIDGPGQGINHIRKIWLTDDNYERAASAAIDYLLTRDEVDPDRIAVVGTSIGSHWGVRTGAIDQRIKAMALTHGCFGSKVPIFEEASPRFKEVFMYMFGTDDEDEFDVMAERWTTTGYGHKITCPTLMVMGEYDPLCHLETAVDFFVDELKCPKELWVFEDDFHRVSESEGIIGLEIHHYLADWINDVFAGKIPSDHNKMVMIPEKSGAGPYEPAVDTLQIPGRFDHK